jgi:hypothetical protein
MKILTTIVSLFIALLASASAQYQGWRYSGSVYLLTTPEGANLPASASEERFPMLVRLYKDSFPFSQVKPNGDDIRFSSDAGKPLAYEIENWDATSGTANIWVRMPMIKGNARQAIHLHWGKSDAVSESNGKAVFNESNGYASVIHMNEPLTDVIGTVTPTDTGTTLTTGMIGKCRNFTLGKGIHCGDSIAGFPQGNAPHSTQAWYRTNAVNCDLVDWGSEGDGFNKVQMRVISPPRIYIDGNFASVTGKIALTPGQWHNVVNTYTPGSPNVTRIYVDGKLDNSANVKMKLPNLSRMWIGGWYNNYRFAGDIEEVRVSKVARSADWIKLEYENQKTLQTLGGLMVRAGSDFAVAPTAATVMEGKSVTFAAKAGGAQKVYWILKNDTGESVVSTDRFSFTFDVGRVVGDKTATLLFKAIYPNEVKTLQIPIQIKEDIPEPVFTLQAPSGWDGRTAIVVLPEVTNLAAMQGKGAGDLKVVWKISGLAATQEAVPGKLILTRAQNSGNLTVTATLSNGGESVTHTTVIAVTEPKSDPWIHRVPGKDEKPEEGQFYARDDKNEGTLYYNGTLDSCADSVFLKVYADDKPYKGEGAKLGADRSYTFTVKLKPGLIKYKVEFGTKIGGKQTVLQTVNNLVCGDAYLIDGQSNALATDTNEQSPRLINDWIRSYGGPTGRADATLWVKNDFDNKNLNLWCNPVWKFAEGKEAEASRKTNKAELGWWGMELAKRLVASEKIPVCFINAAVGGSMIEEHQLNRADPTDLATMYGRMLWRVRQAKLSDGIRGILWHQGENNQGTSGGSGDYDWKSYQENFVKMSGGWKQDFPNVQNYYVFQIWPNSCSMAGNSGAGDRIREIQRNLPWLYSHLSVMSTLGIKPRGGCHYPLAGWSEFARLIEPLIERDNYGLKVTQSITPPDLKRAYYNSAAKETVILEFDQPVVWQDSLVSQFYLNGEKDKIASGFVKGKIVTLQLKEPSKADKITYLKEDLWSQDNLIYGTNGIAALTFCDVSLSSGFSLQY